jgi:beta-mannosidase
MEKHPTLKRVKEFFMEWGMKRGQNTERSIYQNLPSISEIPADLQIGCQVWQAWQFHDAQFMETFENGIATGESLDDFITTSQKYQADLIQFGTECYRRAKYSKVTGIIQFDFTDPWPAVTWSVLDYWRVPKAAYDALRRSMQPILPSFSIPEKIDAGKAALVSFCVVNDLAKAFPGANCEWRLSNARGDIASASFPLDIPSDNVSAKVKLTLPSLNPGKYTLSIFLTNGDNALGENWYQILVDDPER